MKDFGYYNHQKRSVNYSAIFVAKQLYQNGPKHSGMLNRNELQINIIELNDPTTAAGFSPFVLTV